MYNLPIIIKEQQTDIVIVSLFDGLSGGRIATDRVEQLNVLRYYSSEVELSAIKVADTNYPQDIPYRLGDITQIDTVKLLAEIRADFGNVKILLIGGSPCQGFSLAGTMKGSSTKQGIDVTSLNQYLQLKEEEFEFNGQSYLFWEYIRIKEALKPDFFLLENVRVTGKWLPMFNKTLGLEPFIVNSNLVSFQNRLRFYWTNLQGLTQPIDTNTYLKDNYCQVYDKSLILTGRGLNKLSRPRNRAKSVLLDKCPTLLREQWSKPTDALIFYMPDGVPRYPTRREMELMQTAPIGYTDCVSYNDSAAMLGNSFTYDVITHILSHIE